MADHHAVAAHVATPFGPEPCKTSIMLATCTDELSAPAVLRSGVTALDVAWLVEFFGRRGPATPGTEDEAVRRRLLAISLDGLRNRDAGPLPGPTPSAQHYERRWQTEPKRN